MSTASHFHFYWAQCSHIFSFFLNLGFPYASHTPPIHPPHAQKKCFFPRFCQFWNPESPKYWDFPGLHKHRFSGLKTCPQIMVAEYFSRWMIRPKPNLSTKDSSISWCLLWKVQWYPASNNYCNVCTVMQNCQDCMCMVSLNQASWWDGHPLAIWHVGQYLMLRSSHLLATVVFALVQLIG